MRLSHTLVFPLSAPVERGTGDPGRMPAEIGPTLGNEEFAKGSWAESRDKRGPGSGEFPSLS